MTPLLVVLGAAVGAPARYLVDRAVQRRLGSRFPLGTFAVNVAGSFVLGVLAGLPAHGPLLALCGTGFCGALTTYSTFGHETVRLAVDGHRGTALVYALGSVTVGVSAAWCGLLLVAG